MPGQDSVHVPDLGVGDNNISQACVVILLLGIEDVIVSVSELCHTVPTHIAVQVRWPIRKRKKKASVNKGSKEP